MINTPLKVLKADYILSRLQSSLLFMGLAELALGSPMIWSIWIAIMWMRVQHWLWWVGFLSLSLSPPLFFLF